MVEHQAINFNGGEAASRAETIDKWRDTGWADDVKRSSNIRDRKIASIGALEIF